MSYLQAVLKNIPEEELKRINESHERKMKEKQEESEKKVRELKINKSSDKKSFEKSNNKPTNKNSLRRKENNNSQKVEREESFYEALKQAQKELISMCMLNVEDETSEINFGEDSIVISVEEKKYTFSKEKILKSRTFNTELTKSYKDMGKNVYLILSVSKSKNEILLNIKANSNIVTYNTSNSFNLF